MTFRVLDLTTTLAGAYSAHLLSSGGVDVTRVEPPRRAPAAARGAPPARAIPDGGSGPLFGWLAGGHAQRRRRSRPLTPDVVELLAWAATFDAVRGRPDAVVDIDVVCGRRSPT